MLWVSPPGTPASHLAPADPAGAELVLCIYQILVDWSKRGDHRWIIKKKILPKNFSLFQYLKGWLCARHSTRYQKKIYFEYGILPVLQGTYMFKHFKRWQGRFFWSWVNYRIICRTMGFHLLFIRCLYLVTDPQFHFQIEILIPSLNGTSHSMKVFPPKATSSRSAEKFLLSRDAPNSSLLTLLPTLTK